MVFKSIARIKSILLGCGILQIDPQIKLEELCGNMGNIAREPWIFLRLSESSLLRMKLVADSRYILKKSQHSKRYAIYNKKTDVLIIDCIEIESVIAHAPEQMFFLLHKNCINHCVFCPLTYNPEISYRSWDEIYQRIEANIHKNLKSISFTTSDPPYVPKDDLVREIAGLSQNIRKIHGERFVLGASLNCPTEKHLLQLRDAGINEVRLNIETYDSVLASKIMPNKNIGEMIASIKMAVQIFGKNKVSSNIIIGLGENDHSILNGVLELAKIGAIATLYPYDPIDHQHLPFRRPSATRIYHLAQEQKKIFKEYNIQPQEAKTMCCACAASHLYPDKDL